MLTTLDRAHAAMARDENDESARMRYFGAFCDTELFVLLEREVEGDTLEPKLLSVAGNDYVLAFDLQDRLAELVGSSAAYAALPGRVLAAMLAGQGPGIAVNPGEIPSSFLIPPDVVDWLAGTLAIQPEQQHDRVVSFGRPPDVDAGLAEAIADRLARSARLIAAAYLVSAEYLNGRSGLLLVLADVPADAREDLGRAMAEAAVFSGVEGGGFDVAFLDLDDPVMPEIAAHGLRLELPAPQPSKAAPAPKPPGMDPDKPPRLR